MPPEWARARPVAYTNIGTNSVAIGGAVAAALAALWTAVSPRAPASLQEAAA